MPCTIRHPRGVFHHAGYKSDGLDDEQIEQIKAQTAAAAPLGRAGTTDEIAKAALSLLRTIAVM
jgi:hypothetical protein